jgi:hypothetical protein
MTMVDNANIESRPTCGDAGDNGSIGVAYKTVTIVDNANIERRPTCGGAGDSGSIRVAG